MNTVRAILKSGAVLPVLLFGALATDAAAQVNCGDVLIADLTLDGDIECDGAALVIGADGITVDLNGYSISSLDGEGLGVDNSGGYDDVTVKNGVIGGFREAVFAEGASGLTLSGLTIDGVSGQGDFPGLFGEVAAIHIQNSNTVVIEDSSLSLVAPRDGPEAILLLSVESVRVQNVDVDGGHTGVHLTSFCGPGDEALPCEIPMEDQIPTSGSVVECTFTNNTFGVVISNGADVTVERNLVKWAHLDGVGIGICCIPLSGIRVHANEIYENGRDGIRADVQFPISAVEISENEIHDNGGSGMTLVTLRDSTVFQNTVTDNFQLGIYLPDGTGNTISENTVSRNFIDMVETSGDPPNVWSNNCYLTWDGDGIDAPVCCDVGPGAGPDCNGNGEADACDLALDRDCNGNGIPDECDVSSGRSQDANRNGVLDECEATDLRNAGFEEQILADGNYIPRVVPGWSVLDPDGLSFRPGVYNVPVDAFPGEAPEGDNAVYIWVPVDPGMGELTLSQIQSTVLTANTRYTLQVDVGDSIDWGGLDLAGFPGYRVELLAGGTVLGSDNNELAPEEGTFETSVVEFTARPDHPKLGDRLEIRLVNIMEDLGAQVDFDNVRLDASEVEPSFRRGDGNDDGDVNLTDATSALNWLFAGGVVPGCLAAFNTNGDDKVDVADPVFLLNHLFAGGPAPVAPFPDCGPGTLASDEALGCETPPQDCVAEP